VNFLRDLTSACSLSSPLDFFRGILFFFVPLCFESFSGFLGFLGLEGFMKLPSCLRSLFFPFWISF